MNQMHETIAELLKKEPFAPFSLGLADGRSVRVERADQAVLNEQAISVIEAPFMVTVLGLHQIESVNDQ